MSAPRPALVILVPIGDVLPDVLLDLGARAADEGDAALWRTLAMRLWTGRAYAELGLEEAA